MMGNERWICRTVSRFPDEANRGIVEIGAGDGILCNKLAELFLARLWCGGKRAQRQQEQGENDAAFHEMEMIFVGNLAASAVTGV